MHVSPYFIVNVKKESINNYQMINKYILYTNLKDVLLL